MDISGVQIGHGVRLLVTSDKAPPRLFHEIADGGRWCETELGRQTFSGSFDDGDLRSKKSIRCSGKHITGSVVNGQWIPSEVPAND